MFRYLFSFLLVVLSLQSQAQSGTANGTIQSGNKAVESAVVTLVRQKDSSLVKTAVTDKEGKFSFEQIKNGAYIVSVTSIGYERYYTQPFVISAGNTVQSFGIISLIAVSKSLQEVTVSSRKPILEMKADKMVLNVDASPANAGSTALEVLEKAPGVVVDKDGNISLKGKQGVTVLIDGRPTYLSNEDLTNMLKGMTAAQLDQIEVMTNPPARFDASGNGGVINIRTKKNKTKGFNGNVNLNYGQGVYPKVGTGANLNYRVNKLNVFGSLNYNYRKAFQQFSIIRNFINPSTKAKTASFDQRAFMPDTRDIYSGKLGIDYSFSSKTSAAFTTNLFTTDMTYDNRSTSMLYDATANLQSTTYGNTFMTPNVTNTSSNLNFRHQFDSTGRELNFDADYVTYKDKHHQRFVNAVYDQNGILTGKPDSLKGYLPTGFKVYAAKLDYTHPFSANTKLEFGGKISYVDSDNDIRFDSVINGQSIPDPTRTNHFIYREHIYAGYVNFNTPLSKKISVQSGLRYEYTNAEGNQLTTSTKFRNTYGQFFPTVYLSYQMNDQNQFGLNFGRRITRPQYRNLNPFVFIIDKYTFQKGNPSLQPMFTNNIELSHTFKRALTTTLNYSATDGVISEVIEQNEATKETFLIRKNIAKQRQFGIAFNLYLPVNNWLTLISNINLFNNKFKGQVNDTLIELSTNTANMYGAVQTKLGKGWDAEVNGFYNTPGVDGVMLYRGMGVLNFAVSKTVLKNQGKITFNYRDPFKLQRFKGTSNYSTVDATINSRWENSILNITFNYRFGKNFKTNKRSSGSSAEEQSRIN
jgi:outer membrane receptor protein involved in Fe transport